jgi:hypothetical protein
LFKLLPVPFRLPEPLQFDTLDIGAERPVYIGGAAVSGASRRSLPIIVSSQFEREQQITSKYSGKFALLDVGVTVHLDLIWNKVLWFAFQASKGLSLDAPTLGTRSLPPSASGGLFAFRINLNHTAG